MGGRGDTRATFWRGSMNIKRHTELRGLGGFDSEKRNVNLSLEPGRRPRRHTGQPQTTVADTVAGAGLDGLVWAGSIES